MVYLWVGGGGVYDLFTAYLLLGGRVFMICLVWRESRSFSFFLSFSLSLSLSIGHSLSFSFPLSLLPLSLSLS